VYVVDDDEAVRDAVGMLLGSHGFQVRAFASPLDFLADYRREGPDCLVLDVRMPRLSGLELLDRLLGRGEPIPVVFITGHGDIPMAVEAMRKGALDFLVKPFDDDELVRRVSDAFDDSLRTRRPRSPRVRLRSIAALTEREREVLELILAGKTNRIAARELSVTPKTIEYHRARIMRKLRVDSAAELFRFCLDP